MRLSISITNLLIAFTSAIFLAACSGGPQGLPNAVPIHASTAIARGKSWISPVAMREARKGGLLFVSDFVNNVVDIFSATRPTKPIGAIVDLIGEPTGMVVDRSGNLFVCNDKDHTILKFAPPYDRPPTQTYGNSLATTADCSSDAVGPDGIIYMAGLYGSNLLEYASNNLAPNTIVNLPGNPSAVVVDKHDNIFVALLQFTVGGGATILKLSPGSTSYLNLHVPLELPLGMAFDTRGNLVVVDAMAKSVNVYRPGATEPSRRIIVNGFNTPLFAAFSSTGELLYVSDQGSNNVYIISYKSGKTIATLAWSGFGLVQGVAVSPAASQ